MTPTNECVFPGCGKPLGQDSKDSRYLTCHEHRTCSVCSLPLRPPEIQSAWDSSQLDETPFELIHPRCQMVAFQAPADPLVTVRQSWIDRMNNIRLMIEPNMDVSQDTNERSAPLFMLRAVHGLSLEEQFMTLHMLESCVAALSITIRQNPKAKELKANLEKLEKQREKANKEALTSSRPVGKPATDQDELSLGLFMQANGLKDRKIALTVRKDRDKAIKQWVAMGVPEADAYNKVCEVLMAAGRLKTPSIR